MGLFNFRPSVRPVPLEVHIEGFPGKYYCPRMATMNKPCFKCETSPMCKFISKSVTAQLSSVCCGTKIVVTLFTNTENVLKARDLTVFMIVFLFLWTAVKSYSPTKPVLIFVSSRRQTRLTALDLIAYLAAEDDPKQWLHMPEMEVCTLLLQLFSACGLHRMFSKLLHDALSLPHPSSVNSNWIDRPNFLC